jgi:hypothetical protein
MIVAHKSGVEQTIGSGGPTIRGWSQAMCQRLLLKESAMDVSKLKNNEC